jgi:hypothetical protein
VNWFRSTLQNLPTRLGIAAQLRKGSARHPRREPPALERRAVRVQPKRRARRACRRALRSVAAIVAGCGFGTDAPHRLLSVACGEYGGVLHGHEAWRLSHAKSKGPARSLGPARRATRETYSPRKSS